MYYLMIATSPVPIGGRQAVMINHPGDKSQVIQFVREQGLPTKGVKYRIEGPLPQNDPTPMVLLTQIMLPPQVSPEAVAAAMSDPHGQRGQNRPTGQPDGMGFAQMGDEALPVAGDGNMFDEVNDGTISDILQDGGAMREVQRPNV
jgi:hypothetical protein